MKVYGGQEVYILLFMTALLDEVNDLPTKQLKS